MKLKTGIISVFLVQLIVNLVATLTFYKFLRHISNETTAFIILLFFIFNFPFQAFNSMLQTESLFHSITILFSCYLLKLKRLTIRNALFIFLFLLLIIFTRPSGLLFIPCTFLYLFFRFFKQLSIPLKATITLAVTIVFLFVLNTALGSGGELDLMLPFRDERIICGVPTLAHFIDIKTSNDPNSIWGLLYYITHNTGQFLRLVLLRSRAFFGLSRTYYSTGHNIYLYLYFFPFYLFVLLSIRKWLLTNKHLLLYCLSFLLFTWCTVILTCDDWHNRFFLTLMPYIYILSAPFIQTVTKNIKRDAGRASV